MSAVKSYLKKWSAVELVLLVLLVVMTAVVHANWLFTLDPLISGDWVHFDVATIKSWSVPFDRWITFDGIGRQITQGNFVVLYSLYSVLNAVGLGFEIIARLMYFLPAAVLPALFSYKLLQEFVQDRVSSLLGAMVYSLNSYVFIIHGGHLNISVVYGLAPLAFYYALSPAVRASRYKLVAVLLLSAVFEVRIASIITLFAVAIRFYQLRQSAIRQRIIDSFAIIGLWLAANAFWVIPRILSSGAGFSSQTNVPPLNWIRVDDVLTLHHPFWSSQGATDFSFNNPLLVAFVIPLSVLVVLPLTLRTNLRRLTMLFLGVFAVVLLGLLQRNSPLGGIYTWIYNTVPFAYALRESSKLFVVSNLSLAFLFAMSMYTIGQRAHERAFRYGKVLLIIAVLVVSGVSAAPFVLQRGELGKTYQSAQITSELSGYNDAIAHTEGWFRTLWLTRQPKFAYTTNAKPAIDALELERQLFAAGIIEQRGLSYLYTAAFRNLLDMLSVRYIAIPTESESLQFTHFADSQSGNVRQRFRAAHPDLREISPGLFENQDFRNRIYATNDIIALEHGLELFSGVDRPTSTYIFKDTLGVNDSIFTDESRTTERFLYDPSSFTIVDGVITPRNEGVETASSELFQSTGVQPVAIPQEVRTQTGNMVTNGSFDEDTETFSASDCNNFDKTSAESNGIRGTVLSSPQAQNYAEITVETHTACFSRSLQTEQLAQTDGLLIVSFRYKVTDNGKLEFSLYPAAEEPLNRRKAVSGSSDWKTYTTTLPIDQYNLDVLSIVFYLNSTVAGTTAVAAIDDIAMYYIDELPDLYLRTNVQPPEDIVAADVVPFSSVRNTSYHKFEFDQLRQGSMIVFGELFSRDWDITFTDVATRAHVDITTQHVSSNGLMNGWLVTDTGDYGGGKVFVELTYTPEAYTGLSLMLSFGITAYVIWRIWTQPRSATTKYAAHKQGEHSNL